MVESMTLFPSVPEQTGKSDKTYCVSNEDFLLAVFGGNLEEALPVLVSFPGNPLTVSSNEWLGKPWQSGVKTTINLPVEANNYFCDRRSRRLPESPV